jgi:hypothetical protein
LVRPVDPVRETHHQDGADDIVRILGDTAIFESAAFSLGSSLASLPELRRVIASGEYGHDISVSCFLRGLATTQSVVHLSLKDTSISHLRAFAPRSASLITLELSSSWGGFGDSSDDEDMYFTELDLLSACVCLTHLHIRGSLRRVAQSLPFLPCLIILYVGRDAKYGNVVSTIRRVDRVVAGAASLTPRTPLLQLVMQRGRLDTLRTASVNGHIKPGQMQHF